MNPFKSKDKVKLGSHRPVVTDTVTDNSKVKKVLDYAPYVPGDFDSYFTGADTPGNPDAPTGLTVATGIGMLIISWTNPPEALWRSWEIYIGTTANFTPGPSNFIVSTNQIVTSVSKPRADTNGNVYNYYVKVRAVNSRGEVSSYVSSGPHNTSATVPADIGSASITEIAMAPGAVNLGTNVIAGNLGVDMLAVGAGGALMDTALIGTLTADNIEAETLVSADIFAKLITAAGLNAGTIDASEITVTNLDAGNIVAGGSIVGCYFKTSSGNGTRIEITPGNRIIFYDSLNDVVGGLKGDSRGGVILSAETGNNVYIEGDQVHISNMALLVANTNPTLANSWTNNDSSETTYYKASYCKTADGFVHLRGLVSKSGATPSTTAQIFTLPTGCRPSKKVVLTTRTSGPGLIGIDIGSDGKVCFTAGSYSSWISLDGLSFSTN